MNGRDIINKHTIKYFTGHYRRFAPNRRNETGFLKFFGQVPRLRLSHTPAGAKSDKKQ